MSGPKSGYVSVRDEALLAQQRKEREDADARELEQLEKQRLKNKQLEAKAERRRQQLQQREQRRREREAEQAKKQAEAAERIKKLALAGYHKAKGAFETALGQREALRKEHEGLELPVLPIIPELDQADDSTIRAATVALLDQARQYQRDVDDALSSWRQAKVAAGAAQQTRERLLMFKYRAVRGAKDVIAAIGTYTPANRQERIEAELEQLVTRAQEIINSAQADASWASEGELSDNSLNALDTVMQASETEQAKSALEQLRASVQKDLAKARQTLKTAQEQAAQEQVKADQEKRRRLKEMVSDQIHDVLESLHYVVSDIDETAFVKDGSLYAVNLDFPDHAARFELDDDGQLRVEPVRILDNDEQQGEADQDRQQQEDVAFDRAMCSENGLGKILKTTRNRGLNMKLDSTSQPGTHRLNTVRITEMGQTIQESHKQKINEAKLRQRRHP